MKDISYKAADAFNRFQNFKQSNSQTPESKATTAARAYIKSIRS